MKKRTCKECEEELRGRKDQKFCSDYCRNTFNNRLNEDSTKYIRRINNILRKNRRILLKLNPGGKVTVDGITLAEEGFNFHYYTNIYTTKHYSQVMVTDTTPATDYPKQNTLSVLPNWRDLRQTHYSRSSME